MRLATVPPLMYHHEQLTPRIAKTFREKAPVFQ
jgi:hypothetical protein